jgi:hypothetical protein
MLQEYAQSGFSTILANGSTVLASDLSLVVAGGSLYKVEHVGMSPKIVWAKFWVSNLGGGYVHVTSILENVDGSWKLIHAHRSEAVEAEPKA